jgi:hypothetical protein
MANGNTLLVVFIALTGAAVVLQAFVLLAIYIAIRKTTKSVLDEVQEVRTAVLPLINQSRDLLNRVGPRLESISTDLSELTRSLRVQSADLQSAATEALERVRAQTSRMDFMFSKFLDTVDRAGGFVAQTISLPLRQASAIVATAKAVVGALRNPPPRPAHTHATADKDMFV